MTWFVDVICDGAAHREKTIRIETLVLADDGTVYEAGYHSRLAQAEIRGGGREDYSLAGAFTDDHNRERIVLQCRVCRKPVRMRQGTARRLMAGLRDAGVSNVHLNELARTL